MISTHFEFSMYVLGAAFCQQIQIHRIQRMVFSVIEVYDNIFLVNLYGHLAVELVH